MASISCSPKHGREEEEQSNGASCFLRYLPAVKKHAAIQSRHLSEMDREEYLAEAVAAAYVNYHSAARRDKVSALTPSMLANYAVLHVKNNRHVGGGADTRTDVMSPRAQHARGFNVYGLRWSDARAYNCMTDGFAPTWKQAMVEDCSTPVPDQAAFRIDWSTFLGRQTDRTRTAMSLLAAGHSRREVSEYLGTTPPAVTQRMARVERQWRRFQGLETEQ